MTFIYNINEKEEKKVQIKCIPHNESYKNFVARNSIIDYVYIEIEEKKKIKND